MCLKIIALRTKQKKSCKRDLNVQIRDAFRQHAAILEQDGEWEGHNDIGDVEDRLGVYINDVENNRSVNGGADSEAHEEIYNTFLKAKEEAVEQGECTASITDLCARVSVNATQLLMAAFV